MRAAGGPQGSGEVLGQERLGSELIVRGELLLVLETKRMKSNVSVCIGWYAKIVSMV